MTPPSLSGDRAIGSTALPRLLQLTDTHLMASRGGRLLNVDTDASLAAVVAVAGRRAPADAVLITGDIAGDGAADAYSRLERALEPLDTPSFWLPGNHDEVSALGGEFDRFFVRSLRFLRWDVVMLDTQVTGEVGGRLSDAEFAALSAALERAQRDGKHLLVAMHHPLMPLDCDWLDPQRVANAAEIFALFQSFSVRVTVVCGHVHQASDQTLAGIRLLSAPSTSIQFAPKSAGFKVDTASPGYRWLVLHDHGSVDTGVDRVEGIDFDVDVDSSGYL